MIISKLASSNITAAARVRTQEKEREADVVRETFFVQRTRNYIITIKKKHDPPPAESSCSVLSRVRALLLGSVLSYLLTLASL